MEDDLRMSLCLERRGYDAKHDDAESVVVICYS